MRRPRRQKPEEHEIADQILEMFREGQHKKFIIVCRPDDRVNIMNSIWQYTQGQFPVVCSAAMSRLTFGNGPQGQALGLSIELISSVRIEMLKGSVGYIFVMSNIDTHDIDLHEFWSTVNYLNARKGS